MWFYKCIFVCTCQNMHVFRDLSLNWKKKPKQDKNIFLTKPTSSSVKACHSFSYHSCYVMQLNRCEIYDRLFTAFTTADA